MELKNTNSEIKLDNIGLYLSRIPQTSLLTKEEIKLFKLIKKGDEEAKKKIIESNLRLVVSIAKNYINRGLSFEDLIQEGNIGLMTAVKKFDYTLENKFSTYASYWIIHAITRAICDKGSCVRKPVEVNKLFVKYQNAQINLTTRLQRNPTLEEIAKEIGLSVPELEQLQIVFQPIISIDQTVYESDSTKLIDCLSLKKDEIKQEIYNEDLKERLLYIFKKIGLTEKEVLVLVYRYELFNHKKLKYREISEIFGDTYQVIRRIEMKVLKKIQSSTAILELLDYSQNPDYAKKYIKAINNEKK